MSVKIDVKELLGQAKKVEVKTTTKNFKKAIAFLRSLNKVQLDQKRNEKKNDAIEDMDSLEALELNDQNMGSMIEMADTATRYIAETLKLSDKQVEKIDEEKDLDEVMEFAMKLAEEVTGSKAEKAGDDSLKA
ncbi:MULTISPECIES: phage tail tube assembly chaperone [Fructobacillus]|uniref:Uncharacterized protein n=1 Tax=Fructobacillus cardui TaxID=2893170 RepID=A0ABN9YNX9_9LACO|nr:MULTISPECIES: phage tail tube assembly chaperone [Fructobacillus]KMK52930.1 hypothetical protein FEFB_13460 [Fructobacillus sp. EFB-N1]MCK8626661.1 phage tail assembly chaperone [Fructobacillus cardui]CAK1235534.1 unnamed protein product [Fructobacillus cardui]